MVLGKLACELRSGQSGPIVDEGKATPTPTALPYDIGFRVGCLNIIHKQFVTYSEMNAESTNAVCLSKMAFGFRGSENALIIGVRLLANRYDFLSRSAGPF